MVNTRLQQASERQPTATPYRTTFTGHHDFVITQATAGRADGAKLAVEIFSRLRQAEWPSDR